MWGSPFTLKIIPCCQSVNRIIAVPTASPGVKAPGGLELNACEKWLPAHQPLAALTISAFPVCLYFHWEPWTMLPSTPGTLPHSQGGCVSSLLPMELHGGKKLLIDFPFWGMVPWQWVLEPDQQCIQPQLWDVDSMPRRAVRLTISTSRQLPLPKSPAPGSFDKTDKKVCTSEGKRMNKIWYFPTWAVETSWCKVLLLFSKRDLGWLILKKRVQLGCAGKAEMDKG